MILRYTWMDCAISLRFRYHPAVTPGRWLELRYIAHLCEPRTPMYVGKLTGEKGKKSLPARILPPLYGR